MLFVLPSEVVAHIDQKFPWVRNDTPNTPAIGADSIGHVSAIIGLTDSVPPHLLTPQSARYASLIGAVEELKSWLPTWHARGSNRIFTGTPIRVVRQILAACPDEFPVPATHGLPFVADATLRDALRLDIEHVGRVLAYSEWKAATVLGGSVIEALLLWKLGTLPAADIEAAATKVRTMGTACGWKTVKPLNDWHLPDYIEVAAIVPTGNPIIVADTAALLRVVKSYRNLIHPGRAERLAQTCDKRTAYAAVAGMEGVVIDLSR